MIVHRLPARTLAVLFDIDGTLYSHPAYQAFQTDVLIEELARVRGRPVSELRGDLDRFRADYARTHGGAATSLGNAMAALGVDMATSVAWRKRLLVPSRFLSSDALLRAAIAELHRAGMVLVAVTNNPRSVGIATLEALGVADLFAGTVGLDDTLRSKPAREPYLAAAALTGHAPEDCLSVGDRYDVDIAVPLELGMGGVLVDGVEDVYRLPGILALS